MRPPRLINGLRIERGLMFGEPAYLVFNELDSCVGYRRDYKTAQEFAYRYTTGKRPDHHECNVFGDWCTAHNRQAHKCKGVSCVVL